MKTTRENPVNPTNNGTAGHPAATGGGAASGAVIGGLIGALGGPVGAVVGAAAGAVTGANSGFHAADGIEDDETTRSEPEDSRGGESMPGMGGPGRNESTADVFAMETRVPPEGATRSEPRDGYDLGGFSSEGQRQVLAADRKTTVPQGEPEV